MYIYIYIHIHNIYIYICIGSDSDQSLGQRDDVQDVGRGTAREIDLDIPSFNHPVKSILFGFGSSQVNPVADRFTFTKTDLYIMRIPRN